MCSVSNPNNVVADNVVNMPAELQSTVSLLTDNGIALDVYNATAPNNAVPNPNPPTFPAGTLAGFIVADPKAVLNVALLQTLTVSTTLTSGTTTTVEDSAGNNTTLALDLLTLLGDDTKIGVAVETTKPFSGLELNLGGVANVLSIQDALAAGVCE